MKKKLIEVALPLEAINKASAREKSIRHGHPSTLHLWWARRPLAAARAVIFAQMVDDPSAHPDIFTTEKAQGKERQRLFRIIEDLVQWENTTNEAVLERARAEIWQSWRAACAENVDHPRAKELFNRHKLPAFHDPFAGGGSLPLEAQRLGLEAYASDLNPVAVLINKAMIEIPPKFAGKPPVNPESRKDKDLFKKVWHGAQGLAADVRHYGQWMRDEAEKRIGHLYRTIEVTAEMAKGRSDLKSLVGKELTVIAWVWARTVKSPNPAFRKVDVPLASTFMLSTKPGKEAYVEPIIENGTYRFAVRVCKPKDLEAAKKGTKLSRGANFQCLMSGAPIEGNYIKAEGKAGRMGARMMAVIAEGDRKRIYLSPTAEMEAIAQRAEPKWKPDVEISGSTQYLGIKPYGMDQFSELFTNRQLLALTTFSDLAQEIRDQVQLDALAGSPSDNGILVTEPEPASYADAVATYLALCVSKSSDYWSSICIWRPDPKNLGVGHVFSRQAIQMTWDYAEGNPFSGSSGSWTVTLDWIARVVALLGFQKFSGRASQNDAASGDLSNGKLISTDPPYYDNVPYADLSDFFYVWLRRSLKLVFPDLFTTLAVPKAQELVAFAYRHNGKTGAEAFFLEGMTQAMHRLAEQAHPAFPTTIYYAFRQTETDSKEGTSSTGWETFLEAVIRAGLATTGTWPMRTELGNRTRGMGSNALASSIILVCRPRAANAPTATRRDFLTALKAELPDALKHLQRGNIAPVDLAQAAIGPGMAIYTRFAKVLDAEGDPVSVRDALTLINQTLDEALAKQEGDFDADSRWALAWFEQTGFDAGEYGVAETLSKAKNTSVGGMVDAGILHSKGGRVRLLKPRELSRHWDPAVDQRLTAWETVHHLIRMLEADGEGAASELVAKLGSKAEIARELAYRLYTMCERKKRTQEALSYNGLVQSWPEIVRLSRDHATPRTKQGQMFSQE
jgi:putative DNA methylase